MTLGADGVAAELAAAVRDATGGGPRAPVTVVTASPFVSRWARRMIAEAAGGTDVSAGVGCVDLDALVVRLATPALAAHQLRPAPAAVVLEVLRRCGADSPGPWAGLVTHPRGLIRLDDACAELRRCPAATVDAFTRRPGPIGQLARLVVTVRRRLRASGFADAADAADAAHAAVTGGDDAVRGLGPILRLDLGSSPPQVRGLLDVLQARNGGRPVGVTSRELRLTDVWRCAWRGDEETTAVRAVAAALGRGVPPGSLAVLHPPGAGRRPGLRGELEAAGVPTGGPGPELDRTAAGRGLAGLLDVAAGGWRRRDVTAWWSSTPVTTAPGRPGVPASAWSAASAEAGVLGGRAQWRDRLRALATVAEPAGDGRAATARELADFMEGLTADAVCPGSSWSTRATWAAGLVARYLSPEEQGPGGERAGAGALQRTLADLAVLDEVSGPVDDAAFAVIVRAVMARLAVPGAHGEESGGEEPAAHDGDDAVVVAPYAHVRGARFDTVVLLGPDGDPTRGERDDEALLPEEARRLDTSGGLRTRGERREERRQAVAAAAACGVHRRAAVCSETDLAGGQGRSWPGALAGPTTRWRRVGVVGAPAAAPAVRGTRIGAAMAAVSARSATAFTRHDGYVGPGVLPPLGVDAPVSATRLETFAACPRRFLLGRVLKVRRRVPPEDVWEMEPAERGTLVHEVLEQYLHERLAGAPASLEHLLELAELHFDAAERRGRVGRPVAWALDKTTVRRDLERLHRDERQHDHGTLVPVAAELEFGGPPGGGPSVTVALDGERRLAFAGRVDRVDRSPTGVLVVSDYKTGRQRLLAQLRRDPVAGGRLLQLPVYALAAAACFGEGDVRARYWLLSEQRTAPCYELELSAAVRQRFVEVLRRIADAVDAGAFPAAPGARPADRQFDTCRFCDFDRLCPPGRDLDWARKGGAPELAVLRALVDAEGLPPSGQSSGGGVHAVVEGGDASDVADADADAGDGDEGDDETGDTDCGEDAPATTASAWPGDDLGPAVTR